MQLTELAWAAGFFDGEGSTSFYTRKNGKTQKVYRGMKMSVAQSEPSTLERFRDALGFGRIEGPFEWPSHKRATSGRSKPTYQWKVDGLDLIQTAALLLWPYLSAPKQAQIEQVFERYRAYA